MTSAAPLVPRGRSRGNSFLARFQENPEGRSSMEVTASFAVCGAAGDKRTSSCTHDMTVRDSCRCSLDVMQSMDRSVSVSEKSQATTSQFASSQPCVSSCTSRVASAPRAGTPRETPEADGGCSGLEVSEFLQLCFTFNLLGTCFRLSATNAEGFGRARLFPKHVFEAATRSVPSSGRCTALPASCRIQSTGGML